MTDWRLDQLKTLFPNASESTRKLNPHLTAGSPADCLSSGAVEEPSEQSECSRAVPREAFYQVRCRLSITSYRRRLTDGHWNLQPEHFIDALTELHLIRDDSEKEIEVQVQQVNVNNAHEERTIIMIEPLTNQQARKK